MVDELELVAHSTGDVPEACPWWAFSDPDVSAVLRAYDCISGEDGSDELLRQWWGDDPPIWLVDGLAHFKGVLTRVRNESYRLAKAEADSKLPPARPMPGHEVLLEIRG